LIEGGDDGIENGGLGEAGVHAHLGEVLVHEGEGVGAGALKGGGAWRGLVVGDHFFAAAAVAGEGEAGDGVVGGEKAALDKGADGEGEGGGVAAGVGDALGGADGGAEGGAELGHAVGPALGDAVRGGGVDDAGAGVRDQGD
jgi:hypothetical protein